MTTPVLAAITVDCRHAERLASFWAAALDRTVADGASAEFASLEGDPAWCFAQVPEAKQGKNRLHVDLRVDDVEAEAERLVGLGAGRLGAFTEGGYRWVTLADPEGNEFDVVADAA